MRRTGTAATTLLLVAAMTGCSLGSEPVAGSTAPVAATRAASPPRSSAPVAPSAGTEIEIEEEYPAAEPAPTWDAAGRDAATAHAAATMTAFARPQVSDTQWRADLAPLLTLSAQNAYVAVDPAEVPPREVTGPGVITDDSSPYLAWVDVPTDVGTYAVLLVRTAADTAWLTERIVPPATLSEPVGG